MLPLLQASASARVVNVSSGLGSLTLAADPGYTYTDMTQNKGGKPVERGAAVIVRLATLDDDRPTGAFFDENGPMPWRPEPSV